MLGFAFNLHGLDRDRACALPKLCHATQGQVWRVHGQSNTRSSHPLLTLKQFWAKLANRSPGFADPTQGLEMTVFVTGVIGKRVVPLLQRHDHDVTALARNGQAKELLWTRGIKAAEDLI
jgi:hypothetical protein